MNFKFDVGTPINVPWPRNKSMCRGMIMACIPKHEIVTKQGNVWTIADCYIIKCDEYEQAHKWSARYVDENAFVSQLSFKEQAVEEVARWFAEETRQILDNCFVATADTESLHKKLDEISRHWRPW